MHHRLFAVLGIAALATMTSIGCAASSKTVGAPKNVKRITP